MAYMESARVTVVKKDGTTIENLRGGVGWRDDRTPEISILGLGGQAGQPNNAANY